MIKFLDKLIFGVSLLLALQFSQVSEHYHQYLAGLYQSTKWQVDGFQETANKSGYGSIDEMISVHLQNSEFSVRQDASQKLRTLERFDSLSDGMDVFENGNLVSKLIYIFNPNRIEILRGTLRNFSPGIPLETEGLIIGVLGGFMINFVIMLPINLICQVARKKQYSN